MHSAGLVMRRARILFPPAKFWEQLLLNYGSQQVRHRRGARHKQAGLVGRQLAAADKQVHRQGNHARREQRQCAATYPLSRWPSPPAKLHALPLARPCQNKAVAACMLSALRRSGCPLGALRLLIGCCMRLMAEAKHLAALGAEVVEADATDGASLRSAFDGAYGVFALTVTVRGPPTTQELYEAEVKLGAS